MKFFGKEIATDKINFVMNCVSFVLGLIFFIRMQSKMSLSNTAVNYSSERDSLIIIETRVKTELKEIKKVQDSITRSILINQNLLKERSHQIKRKRSALYITLNNDWEEISKEDQNTYINKLMYNLKQKK